MSSFLKTPRSGQKLKQNVAFGDMKMAMFPLSMLIGPAVAKLPGSVLITT
jgi:hypothetical protein